MRTIIILPGSLLLLLIIAVIGFNPKKAEPSALYPAPSTATDFVRRADLYYEEGNYQKALADYVEAEQLAPDESNVYLGQANALSALGQTEAAIEKYEIVRELNQSEGQSTAVVDFLIEKEQAKR